MVHQEFQEAIEQLSEGMNSEEIRNNFNLSKEDMLAMESHNPLMETVAPRPTAGYCCSCCFQSDN